MTLPFANSISLKDIDQVKLMNRMDTKYWFHSKRLNHILNQVKDHYYILEIENKQVLSYSTTYFDTKNDSMYKAHHNGRLNRFKVRHRTYVESGISFLEIKQKNNKGRTIKTRIKANNESTAFTDETISFLSNNCPFSTAKLNVSIKNQFRRITLVSKLLNERCTIDIDLSFNSNNQEIKLNDLAIVEIKTDGSPTHSILSQTLNKERIKKTGFSKYCIGRALTNQAIKHNAFKPNLRKLNKTLELHN